MSEDRVSDLKRQVLNAFAETEPDLDGNDTDKDVIIEMVESVKQSFFRGRSDQKKISEVEQILENAIRDQGEK